MIAQPFSRHRIVVVASCLTALLSLAACSSVTASAPTPSSSPTPTGGVATPADDPTAVDPAKATRCDPKDASQFGVVPSMLPAHWPSDIPVIPGPCFAAFELADSTGGYALEISVARNGTNVDFDNYPWWQAANKWLTDAGMEAVAVDTHIAGDGRQSIYREGLKTSSLGDDFYHYELRLTGQETEDGYVVFQYQLNLLNI